MSIRQRIANWLCPLAADTRLPIMKLQDAVDDVNAAIAALPLNERHVRVFTLPIEYGKGKRKPQRMVLGFWSNGNFEVTYNGIEQEKV